MVSIDSTKSFALKLHWKHEGSPWLHFVLHTFLFRVPFLNDKFGFCLVTIQSVLFNSYKHIQLCIAIIRNALKPTDKKKTQKLLCVCSYIYK